MPERCAQWRAASDNWVVTGVTTEVEGPAEYRIRVQGSFPDIDSTNEIVYTVFGSGEIEVGNSFQPGSLELSELPRFGMQMTLPGGFEAMSWYGRGPHESYWDRKDGAAVGVYKGSVDDQWFDYSEPQENGNKTDVRWVSLSNSSGIGLQAVGDEPLSVSARRYTTADMERAKHTWEMEHQDFVILNLDHKQTGVGGDNSWGARAHPEYTLEPKAYHYSFRLRPIGAGR